MNIQYAKKAITNSSILVHERYALAHILGAMGVDGYTVDCGDTLTERDRGAFDRCVVALEKQGYIRTVGTSHGTEFWLAGPIARFVDGATVEAFEEFVEWVCPTKPVLPDSDTPPSTVSISLGVYTVLARTYAEQFSYGLETQPGDDGLVDLVCRKTDTIALFSVSPADGAALIKLSDEHR